MVSNNFPVSSEKDFPVRPELVEGWTGKSGGFAAPDRSCLDKLSIYALEGTNGLAGKVISGSYLWRNPLQLSNWKSFASLSAGES
jgi:hypothetical protein